MSDPDRLSYTEAEEVAADLARGWTGITGHKDVPSIETLADLVQRTLRKAGEVIEARKG